MFTPQRKGFPGWSISPRGDGKRNFGGNGSVSLSQKGKGVAGFEELPPPLASLGRSGLNVDSDNDLEVWQRFREEGLLDEAALEKKDKEALVQRISNLEQNLYEYQHNMGLLLIEKKEWTSKREVLRQALAATDEILKREQAAHIIAISEVEKREENLRHALGVEKQCVADLENALEEMRTEAAGIKFTSEKKFADSHALVNNIEEKSLEVEAKLHAAENKLAEASRNSLEVERKLQELETLDSVLHKERLSLQTAQQADEASLAKHKEDMQEWQMNLKGGNDRLLKDRKLLDERVDLANEKERALNQEEKHLEEAQKKIDVISLDLKKREADISTRSSALAVKEKDAIVRERNLDMKEKALLALEEKLNTREKMEIQRLMDEHNALMELKKHEFELEMDEKRKSMEEELKSKVASLKQKEDEVNHKETKVTRREQNLEIKSEKLKEKERSYELKLKALKDRDKSVRAEEKALKMDKNQIEADQQVLLNCKADLELQCAAAEEEKQLLSREQENMKVTEEERSAFHGLQLKLKEEINSYNSERESLTQEKEDLKQERDRFEREWEALDDKRAEIAKNLDQFSREREFFAKWKYDEEDKLKNERLEMESYIRRELEAHRLEQSAFESTMQHERSEMLEQAQREHDDIVRNFEIRSHELEADMQNRKEDMEKQLFSKERAFQDEKERTLSCINSIREQVQGEMDELRLKEQQFERKKLEIGESRKDLQRVQVEVRNDINELHLLSKNLIDQREAFIKENQRLFAVIKEHKSCRNCGELILTNLQLLPEIEDTVVGLQPRLAEGYLRENIMGMPGASEKPGSDLSPGFGVRMSWLQKCASRIFNISPGNKAEDPANQDWDDQLDEAGHDVESLFGVASDSTDIHRMQSESSVRYVECEPSASVDAQSDMAKVQGLSGIPSSSVENAGNSGIPRQGYGRLKPAKEIRLRGTRSVKQVVNEAKNFLGETLELNKDGQRNGKVKDPAETIEGSREDSRTTNVGQKRQYTQVSQIMSIEQDAANSETQSDRATTGGQRKRRQTADSGLQTPGQKRYNFRRSTVAGRVAGSQALLEGTGGIEKVYHPGSIVLPENSVTEGFAISGELAVDDGVNMKQKLESPMAGHKLGRVRSVEKEKMEFPERQESSWMEKSEDVEGSDGDEYEEDDDDEEEDHENGDASIGRILWNFFTT